MCSPTTIAGKLVEVERAVLACALLASMLGACLPAAEQRCADNTICPADRVCVAGGCALPEQLRACEGLPDTTRCTFGTTPGVCVGGVCVGDICGNERIDANETCDDGNQASGDGCSSDCQSDETCGNGTTDVARGEECDDGNLVSGDGCQSDCTKPRCGDGAVDAGEVCDDGGTVSGDGCSFDCRSDETCGNGIFDPAAGEECDDGNLLSHDSCSSGCRPELPLWTEVTPAVPPARHLPGFAYDAARGTIVMFSGSSLGGSELKDTWTWDGTAWVRQQVAVSPRDGAFAMTFDARRRRVVLVDFTTVAEVWEWTGAQWIATPSPAVTPPLRHDTAIAYDAARGRIVLFGGAAPAGTLGDTWEWDGTTWTDVTPAISPPARSLHAMAYDAKRGRIVLVGGKTELDEHLGDTWEWDGTTWTGTAAEPTAAAGGAFLGFQAAMTFDPIRGRVVWFQGSFLAMWDGTAWSDLPNLPTFEPRLSAGLAYDTARRRIVVFGGSFANIPFDETWELDDTTWRQRVVEAPEPRTGTAMAYDARRGRLVLFGGLSSSALLGDTWEWDGRAWTQRFPAQAPSPRRNHAMTYDSVRGKIVLTAGVSGSGASSDYFEWDGETWSGGPVTGFLRRERHAMAYDPVRQRVIVSGGLCPDLVAGVCFDTVELDGGTVTGGGLAPDPVDVAMVFDEARQRVVRFGGAQTATAPPTGATHEWDGTEWVLLTEAGPPPRKAAALAYDPIRRRAVLFGGINTCPMPPCFLRDAWEWNGVSWSDVTLFRLPPPRSGFAMSYVATAQAVVAFGGGLVPGPRLGDTWTYRLASVIGGESCRFGFDADGDGVLACDDPDCWGVCTPGCPPGTTCGASTPSCGDTVCSAIEDCRVCPTDCGSCPAACGDYLCDPGESQATCPADCS